MSIQASVPRPRALIKSWKSLKIDEYRCCWLQAEDADATTSSSDEETDAVKEPAAANGTVAAAGAAAAPGAAKDPGPGLKSGTAEGGRLVQEEQSATGGVSWAVVKAYINALGGYPVVFMLFSIFILAELFRVGATVWLSIWTGMHGAWGCRHKAACWAVYDSVLLYNYHYCTTN